MKRFNTTGKCNPKVHYMVNIDRQVEAAARLVRRGDYFCINRGRQYGKTTTLAALKERLEEEGYLVFSISFEGLDDIDVESLNRISGAILQRMASYLKWEASKGVPEEVARLIKNYAETAREGISSVDFAEFISELCNQRSVVMIIDEVDQSSNYAAFVKLLGLLRNLYLKRDVRPTFQSVVLAGVYDIKNLKVKLRPEEEHQYNSPWNIAVPFLADMALPENGIDQMLQDYAHEHQLTFDTAGMAREIRAYTAGYPFLVSRLCQIIDEEQFTWDKQGLLRAVNAILKEENTLFDDLVKKLEQYPKLKDLIRHILYLGVKKMYSADEYYLQLAMRFNFLTEKDGYVQIACRLMETRLYNLFIAESNFEQMSTNGQADKNQYVHDGMIDMRHLLERFAVHFNDIFRTTDGKMDQTFVEKQGRQQFLLYLRPIINGIGNYYIEAETRDETRTDVIVDYLGQQYVIELKIWHGNAYNERGEKQLAAYLDYYHLQTGYLVCFCFNRDKQPGIREVAVGNRKIVEVIV